MSLPCYVSSPGWMEGGLPGIKIKPRPAQAERPALYRRPSLCSVRRTGQVAHTCLAALSRLFPWLLDCLPKSLCVMPCVSVVGSPWRTARSEALSTDTWVRSSYKGHSAVVSLQGSWAGFLSGASLRDLQKELMNATGSSMWLVSRP